MKQSTDEIRRWHREAMRRRGITGYEPWTYNHTNSVNAPECCEDDCSATVAARGIRCHACSERRRAQLNLQRRSREAAEARQRKIERQESA